MRQPAVSVVIPTRNRAALLRESLDSVESQTLPDWECLIVDDGSDDTTVDEVRIRASEDPRFRLVVRSGETAGANTCRNLGAREARSDLIVFLDSDDLLAHDCLARRVEVMRRNPDVDFVVFDGDVFLERPGDYCRLFDMGVAGDDLDRFLALDPPWDTTGPIWRKAALDSVRGWDVDLLSWQDVDLHVRALASGPRYFRERTVDHHIRWQANQDRTSFKKAFSTTMFDNCEACVGKWRQALYHGRTATPARDEALAGIAFHLAEQWALQRDASRGRHVWRGARRFGIARGQVLLGSMFLTGMSTPLVSTTAFQGLLRRWKVNARIMPPTPKRPSA